MLGYFCVDGCFVVHTPAHTDGGGIAAEHHARQANVLRMQGEWQQSMEQSEQHDTQQQRSRSHELQEINQLNMRRAEINDRLQYLGQVDAADNTVSEAMEYDRLTEEKRTLEARLADLQKKYAPRY